MWIDSTTVLQWLHSLKQQPDFVSKRVNEILELTTVDEWNQLPKGDKPADDGIRGLSVFALFECSWFRRPDFLGTFDWPFIPSTDVITKIKSKKFAPGNGMMKKETHEAMTLTTILTNNASTFEWQKYSSHQKRLRILAYKLPISPKFNGNRTNSGSITDTDELLEAERRLFLLFLAESFPAETKNLLKSAPNSKASALLTLSFFIGHNEPLGPTWRTKQLENAISDVEHLILFDSRLPLVRLYLQHLYISSVICSENGTNFIAMEKELNNILNWNQQVSTETLVKRCIKWKFNPSSAPHHSSVWEWLVRSQACFQRDYWK